MKKIFEYWEELETGREGYTVADITFNFDAIDEKGNEHYGKERKSLNAAINDAKRFFKTHPEQYFSIYSYATLTKFYNDGTQKGKPDNDCARIGTIDPNGEYFDMCEPVDWLD